MRGWMTWRLLALCTAFSFAWGCGSTETAEDDGNSAGADTSEAGDISTGDTTFVGNDTSSAGDGAVTEDGDATSSGDGEDDGDGSTTAPKPCAEAGGWGCDCQGNNDCNSQWCVQTEAGKKCTVTCLETCPSNDWACVQASAGGGGDLTYVCVPKFTTLCEPCATDAECEHLAAPSGKAKCVSAGKDGVIAGSFCSGKCTADSDCPSSYSCQETAGAKYCLPKEGECTCSPKAIAAGASTTCSVTTSAGTCTGTRTCTKDGLGACSAKQAEAELCNGKDDDCDGDSDEGFVFDDGGTPKGLGKVCGVGACIGGEVQCSGDGGGVVCTTSAKAKQEICDYVDNDCDGQTDEALGVKDSSCLQVGVCATGTAAVCEVGAWKCSYAAVAGYQADKELTCDGQDNDCDGSADEDFVYAPAGATQAVAFGEPCDGVGACGLGTVECTSDNKGAICSTDALGSKSEAKPEVCDGVDNNCDGQVDEGCDDDKDGYCDDGIAYVGANATCPNGKGDCNDQVADISPGATETCDNVDNDCDASTDESCDDDGDGYCDEAMVVIGLPKACTLGVGDCNDVSPAINPGAQEACNTLDDDCDGKTDAADASMAKAAPQCENQQGVCKGSVKPLELCAAGAWGACTDPVYAGHSKAFDNTADELSCDDLDNDCSGTVDDSCDKDQDGYCDANKTTVGKPAICKKGEGDCNDGNGAISPSAQEDCNNVDDDCDSKLDANDPDLILVAPECENQKGACKGAKKPMELCKLGQWEPCNDQVYVSHSKDYSSVKGETACDEIDNDCSGTADETCDKDKDGYCDSSKTIVGKPAICPKGGNDCNDGSDQISPAANETCDGGKTDENCNGAIDEEDASKCELYYPDLDSDSYGDKYGNQRCLCAPDAKQKYTSKANTDCDDKKPSVNPGVKEDCSTNEDDDCSGATNDVGAVNCTAYYVDADGDTYGDKGKPSVCLCAAKPGDKLTATKSGDCDDALSNVNPGVVESCITGADDNCNGTNNDISALGCTAYYPDSDKDTFGAKGASAVCLCAPEPKLNLTSQKATDCDDQNDKIKPGITDVCATQGIDDNCDGTTDPDNSTGCKTFYLDVDGDGYGVSVSRCICAADAAQKYTAAKAGDCNDSNNAIKPGSTETCDGIDNDCTGGVDNNAVANCKTVPNAKLVCASGKCAISACSTNWFDIDTGYDTGCECAADSDTINNKATACTNFFDLGTVPDNKTVVSHSGRLSPGQSGKWLRYYATDSTDTSADKFHTIVKFTTNSSSDYEFDIYKGACTSTTTRICANETLHEWRTDFYSTNPASGPDALPGTTGGGVKAPSPSTKPSGEGKCSNLTSGYSNGQALPGANLCKNNSAYFYVYVHRKAGAADKCDTYTLTVQNGL